MKKIIPLMLCVLLLASCGNPEVRQTNTTPATPPVHKSAEIQNEQVPQKEPDSKPIAEPDLKPAHSEALPTEEKNEPIAQLVSITVSGLDGKVIYSAEKEHRKQMTALDLLLETAEEKNVPVIYSGGKSAAYVTGIGGLSEKDNGPESGWVYTINDEIIMRPCGKCLLSPNDKVVFKYITEFSN